MLTHIQEFKQRGMTADPMTSKPTVTSRAFLSQSIEIRTPRSSVNGNLFFALGCIHNFPPDAISVMKALKQSAFNFSKHVVYGFLGQMVQW
jgi:hypothetical protein